MIPRLLAAIAALAILPVAAQTATPRADKRQANQDARIEQGVKSGELTKREEAKLKAGQARVENKEAQAKADGKVTAKEKAEIERAQDRQSRKIAKQKHDKQDRK